MTRIVRIVSVTLGLIGAGFIFGALAGGVAFTAVMLMEGEGVSLWAFGIGAIYGAALGAITAPLLSWLLLRRVPLGLMFAVCSVGTMVGGVTGWITSQDSDPVERALLGALIGCGVAAIALWMRVRHVPTSVR